MKVKTYVQGLTFFTSSDMHQKLKTISDDRRISNSRNRGRRELCQWHDVTHDRL